MQRWRLYLTIHRTSLVGDSHGLGGGVNIRKYKEGILA